MKNRSYTWFPKDWAYSDSTFSLTLAERGAYRELIDLAMTQDNKVKAKWNEWVRRWNTTKDELIDIMARLESKGLIEVNDNKVFIPSCEERLKFIRKQSANGAKGGRPKVEKNPNETQTKATEKPKVKKSKVNINIIDRELSFKQELSAYIEKYGAEMVRRFFVYWSEPNQNKNKMRWEMEKTWDTNRRLITWYARQDKKNKLSV
jgi:hypothetical protein